MGLRLILGNAGSGKSRRLFEHIIEESIKNPDKNYIIVVPEQFTLQTQKDIVRLHPRHGILNIDILSFNRLCYRIFSETGGGSDGVLVDDMGKNLILRHLSSGLSDDLPVIGKNLKRLGYITEVKSVISEMMQYGIGPSQAEALIHFSEAEGKQLLGRKLAEIRLIYEEFTRYIKDKYVTAEELPVRAGDRVNYSKLLKKSVIAFDGFTGFTPVQYKLIGDLMENCIDIYATILIDVKREVGKDLRIKGIVSEHELFYMSKKTFSILTGIADRTGTKIHDPEVIDRKVPIRYSLTGKSVSENSEITEDSGKNRTFSASVNNRRIAFLEDNIFRPDKAVCADEGGEAKNEENSKNINSWEEDRDGTDTGSDVYITNSQTNSDEITDVCKRIGQLVRQNGYKYRDIAIVTGDIDGYGHALAGMMDKYDIPYFVDRTLPILLNPCTEYIRAFYSVIIDNYSYDSVIRYLRTPVTDISMEETDLLDDYLFACGIRGRNAWNRKFIRKRKNFREENLLKCDDIRKKIVEDFNLFEKELSGKGISGDFECTVRKHCESLYGLLKRNSMENKLNRMAGAFEKDGNALKAKEMSQIYAHIIALLDKLTGLLGDETVSITEFSELLDAGFDEIRIGIIPSDQDYVQIGDIKRSRLRDIKALFFVGVNDGIIPKRSQKGGLISDTEREFLSGNTEGITLAPSIRETAYTERLYLYMLLSKPSEKLFISYPSVAAGGESLKPSYLIREIREMLWDVKIDSLGHEPETPVFTEKTAYTAFCTKLRDYIDLSVNESKEEEKKRELTRIKYEALLKIILLNNSSATSTEASEAVFRQKLKTIITSALHNDNVSDLKLNPAVSKAVFGDSLRGSVTRLENYAECAYKHFVMYGLSLRERDEFGFEAGDLGSLFHDALMYYGRILKEEGKDPDTVSSKDREALAASALDRAIGAGDYSVIYSSYRMAYNRERILRILKRTVDVLSAQQKKGSFVPEGFECVFSGNNDLSSLNIPLKDGRTVRLFGQIDRYDTCVEGENVYIKIIDYKSSDKDLDLLAVYKGIQLQLIVYLNAAEELIKRGRNPEEGINTVTAGVFYYHIDDPIIIEESRLSDSEIEKAVNDSLRMKGIVNSDPKIFGMLDRDLADGTVKKSDVIHLEIGKDGRASARSKVLTSGEFKLLSEYVNLKIADMAEEILDGDISVRPQAVKKDSDACKECRFGHLCNFRPENRGSEDDNDEGGDLSKDDILALMKKRKEAK
ncbi:MAG: PD-(D/E)XK nuclease family protein [Lachnospiraceae bacterium]|nr:PD-(D/E)XK nuclease family protein [Lachnospiraceae bacterium]